MAENTPDEAPALRSILDRLSALAAQGPVTLELQSVFGCPLWKQRFDANSDIVGNRDPYRHVTFTETVGWKPSCNCDAGEPIPCTVLDPFHGAGTSMIVARRLGHAYVGIDLNPAYVDMSIERLKVPVVFPHERVKPTKRCKKVARQTELFDGPEAKEAV